MHVVTAPEDIDLALGGQDGDGRQEPCELVYVWVEKAPTNRFYMLAPVIRNTYATTKRDPNDGDKDANNAHRDG